jgi:hypothetical protein
MATPAGLGGQFGYVSETTVGTLTVVDKFLPVTAPEVEQEIERHDSMGIRAGRLITAAWKPGSKTIGGTLETELWNTDIATLLRHMFGAVQVATNGGQWNYTYTPADQTGKSMTWQVGKPAIDGTVHPFTWGGVKIGSWTLTAEVGSLVMLSLDAVAMTETNGVSLAVASYDATLAPFVFTEASLLVAGSTNNVVSSFEMTCDNGLTERPRLGSDTSREYLQNGFREITGTFTKDFESLTQYNRFVDADETALVLKFDNGTERLVITCNVRYDGGPPSLSGPELLEEEVTFKVVHSTSDALGITAVLTSAEGFTGAN